ncbi:MAG: hypothetical protein F7C07_08610, partial [Desulfurococcales archaeon]|nr:hypothetical protein [Desulfurococcales archaeon]
QLSLDPSNFSLGNLIVNIGGDLTGTRSDGIEYSRVIALGLDIYKDPADIGKGDNAWPNLWYTANLRSHEVWYRIPNDSRYYRGIWDTSDGSLGTGRITDYKIGVESRVDPPLNNVYDVGIAERMMEDPNLTYIQRFILEPRKPYVKVELVAINKSQYEIKDVRVTLAFDNLDWWLYKYAYVPGVGFASASSSGFQIAEDEREYSIAWTSEGKWEPIVDEEGRSWWPAIFYSEKPLGANRGLIVLVNSGFDVRLWGYGSLLEVNGDPYDASKQADWYFRWMKFEIHIGDLSPDEAETVEVRIIPIASYAPSLERLYLEMASNLDALEGRDFSYALSTGTGAFKGLAMAGALLASKGEEDLQRVQRVIDSVGRVMEWWGWKASTRTLANYVLALSYLYDYTEDKAYLGRAVEAAQTILQSQIRDPDDPRDGGFLDMVPPYGSATYLDVNAEAANALLTLFERTGDSIYKEAVDYWLENWFRREIDTGRWYYYRYRSIEDAPSEYWYRGYLDEEQPYAHGYFLQALAIFYWDDDRLLESFNRVMELLTDEFWIPTWEGAGETNVETQSSVAAGLYMLQRAYQCRVGAGLELIRGGWLKSVGFQVYESREGSVAGLKYSTILMTIAVEKPKASYATIGISVPSREVLEVSMGGVPANPVKTLEQLELVGEAYYWDPDSGLLYMRLHEEREAQIVYNWVAVGSGEACPPIISNFGPSDPIVKEPPPTITTPAIPVKPLVVIAIVIVLASFILGFAIVRKRFYLTVGERS